MATKLSLFQIAISATMICVASESSGQYADQRELDVYNSKRTFFERSGFGAVALMPHVTSESESAIEFEYITFPESGRYHIAHPRAASRDWWFILNHRSGSGASQQHTYAGVFVAKRLKGPLDSQLQLLRNAGWSELSGADLEEFEDTHQSWTDFFELQDSDATEESFEQALGDWHAIPDPQTDESSWIHRRHWLSKPRVDECFQAIGGKQSADTDIFYQAHLIRFQITSGSNSRSPVDWRIGLRDADAFFIKTFSPEGIDLNGEYCVAID